MPTKLLIFIGMTVGSTIGGYIPTLFGADFISYTSFIFSGIGAIIGIYIGYKLSNY